MTPHDAHSMTAMYWSMGVLGIMPFVLVAVGVIWYFRTQRNNTK
jgi:hypothetical protein